MYFIPPPARGRRHNTAHHSRGNGKQGTLTGVGSHNTAHAEMESKARNPEPVFPYSKRPRLKSGAFFIFAS